MTDLTVEPPARPVDAPATPNTSQPGGATTLITSWPSWLCRTCDRRYSVEQPCCDRRTRRVRVEIHDDPEAADG